MNGNELLKINGVKVVFEGGDASGNVTAVDDVTLTIGEGEIFGLVGESGCGKTTLAMTLLGLVDPNGRIDAGSVMWSGTDLLKLSEREMRKIRGKEIAMIFQQPQMALNPVYKVGHQMMSLLRLHHQVSKQDAERESLQLLKQVRISDANRVMEAYPDQLSGGMAQRVMLAMALSCKPKLLVADEPTASLDVTIQAQIMELLLEIREKFEMAILIVSHDLGVVARLCDKVAVMYLGRIVEIADTKELYSKPFHPYTKALLDAVPLPDPEHRVSASVLEGDLPRQAEVPGGCRFRTRCPSAFAKCEKADPMLMALDGGAHLAACWLLDKEMAEESASGNSDFIETVHESVV